LLLSSLRQFLVYRKQLKRLSKELSFRKNCETAARRIFYLKRCLFTTARNTQLAPRQLVSAFYKITQQQGIDQAGYQLWLAAQAAAKTMKLVINHYDEHAYIGLLGENDQLNPECQVLIAENFQIHPQVLLIYTDHDELDSAGIRYQPCFKPAWNPDLFYSINYLGSSIFVRRTWYLSLNLPAELELEAFLWRVLPNLQPQHIFHLPRICYHRQQTLVIKQQPVKESLVLPKLALAALEVEGAELQVGLIAQSRRWRFPLPKNLPLVSLLIPSKDQLSLLKACIHSILEKTQYPHYEILIINNNSQEPETLSWLEYIQQQSNKITVLAYNQEFNYSAINNFAVSKARGSIIGLINNDIEVINSEWLTEMVSQACRVEIGCVGAKLYYPDGRIQHAGVILGSGGGSGHAHRYYPRNDEGYQGRLKLVQNFTAVTGACLVVRKQLYEMVGGLNELDLPIAWSDIDLCLKIRQLGYRNLWTPYAELYHHESVSRGKDKTKAQRRRYRAETAYMHRTWQSLMYQDPCYNPNLTVIGEGFGLGLPIDSCQD
jgi:GT2 family glycosyltransferase